MDIAHCVNNNNFKHIDMKYPFKEGDDYYIVIKHKDKVYNLHDYEILWSCWDDVSEEMYKVKPTRRLFKTRNEAQEYISNLKKGIL